MLKRILAIALGIMLGSVLAIGVTQILRMVRWGPAHELDESSAYVREVLELVKRDYVDGETIEVDDMTAAALEGLLQSLDPHSDFMRARDYSHLREDIDSEFGGIGVQIEMRGNQVVVIAPIAGSPGERAGILRGDRVLEVDGESMRGRSMEDVVGRMRGRPGSTVDVAFGREGYDEPIRVHIVREQIRVESVTNVNMIHPGIGYLRLTQFSEPTAEELRAALNTLSAQGMRALVLDLRNNPGGLLTSAAAVAEPFFTRGELMVYTQGRRTGDREEFRSENDDTPFEMPIAVLINAGSASAAEIVAGALKDTGKAVVIGERSFGKGSVQSIYRLRNGEAMRLTTGRYYTPSGVTVHERGVSPHVEVVMTPEEDFKVALQRARDDIDTPEDFEERFGFTPIEDRQLGAALGALQAKLLIDARERERETVTP